MLGEYLGAGASTTKLLLHLNGNSTDSSGNGNNGTDTSITYSLANGIFGQGAGFNGTSSKIKCTPAGAAVFTMSFWMNATALTNGRFIANRNRSDGKADKGIAITTGNKLRFNTYDGVTPLNIISNLALSTGVWYHIVGVFNGSSSQLYINSVLDNSGTLGTFTTGSEVHLGASGAGGDYFSGKIDEFIIEDVVWTPEYIKKYYTYSKGRFGIL